jgi:hypothetical protein
MKAFARKVLPIPPELTTKWNNISVFSNNVAEGVKRMPLSEGNGQRQIV